MSREFDIQPFPRKPLPKMDFPDTPPAPATPPPPPKPASAPRKKRPPMPGAGRPREQVCKVCGAPRYEKAKGAFCLVHWRDYNAKLHREWQQQQTADAHAPSESNRVSGQREGDLQAQDTRH